jgi:signal transduction histidine kinase
MRLSRHLFLLVLLTLTLPVALLVFKQIELRAHRAEELNAAALHGMQIAEAKLDAVIGSTREIFATLAQLRIASLPRDDCNSALARVKAASGRYAYVAIADLRGSIVCASDAGLIGSQFGSEPHFREAIASGRMIAGRYGAAARGAGEVLPLAAPVRLADGVPQGVILAGMLLNWLPAYLEDESGLPMVASVAIADRDGTIIAGLPDSERARGQRLGEPYLSLLHNQQDGVLEYTGSDGKVRIIAYSPPASPPLDLFVAVTYDKESFFAALERDMMRDTLVIVATVLLATGAAWSIAERRFGVPIRRLADTALHWSEGDYGAQPRLDHRVHEIGELGRVFDNLAGKLALRERQLRSAAADKASLLAVAGHDLRQPLQVLTFVVGRLGRPGATSGEQNDLARAEKALDRLSVAFDRLIDVARLDAAEAHLTRGRVPLGDLFRDIADEWLVAAETKGVRLRFVPSSAVAVSDPDMLRTILRNLVGNAIKYTERGGVLIGARRRGDCALIQVADTGRGIAEDALPMIFGAFRQIDPKREGFGLGLSIVQRTADALGHRLAVSSVPGKGSRFSVEVPLAAA